MLILAPSMIQRDKINQNQIPDQSQVSSRCHRGGQAVGHQPPEDPASCICPGLTSAGLALKALLSQPSCPSLLKPGLMVCNLCRITRRGSCLGYQPGGPGLGELHTLSGHTLSPNADILFFSFFFRKEHYPQPPGSLLPSPDLSLVCIIRQFRWEGPELRVRSLDLNLKPSHHE